MMEKLLLLGMGLILLGTFVIIVASLMSDSKAEYGVVGFIGPFPIGFGSNKNMLFFAFMLGLIILLLMVMLHR